MWIEIVDRTPKIDKLRKTTDQSAYNIIDINDLFLGACYSHRPCMAVNC